MPLQRHVACDIYGMQLLLPPCADGSLFVQDSPNEHGVMSSKAWWVPTVTALRQQCMVMQIFRLTILSVHIPPPFTAQAALQGSSIQDQERWQEARSKHSAGLELLHSLVAIILVQLSSQIQPRCGCCQGCQTLQNIGLLATCSPQSQAPAQDETGLLQHCFPQHPACLQ